jgi:flagellar biosynthesis/type III secretory pathway protein FliH
MNSLDKTVERSENNKFIVKKFLFAEDFTSEMSESIVDVMEVNDEHFVDTHALEVEEKFQEGYQQGLLKAESQFKTSSEARSALLLDSIKNSLESFEANQIQIAEAYEMMMMRILEQTVVKVFPEMINQNGFDEVFAFVRDALTQEQKASEFLVYVGSSEKDMLEKKVEQLELDGRKKITVIEDASFKPGDCRLCFDETVIERSTERVIEELLKAIGRFRGPSTETEVICGPNTGKKNPVKLESDKLAEGFVEEGEL